MSSLDKLAIRGIRSFDHNDISVMQFYSPLTVIVGHNGSGKTTIIECLKYATTGDLPPNTKGGAFVHDPSIAGTSEVKGQVKLRFFNSRKEKMLVERRLQVTKKKTAASGLTMKTLEGTISFVDEEEISAKKRTSLSTKCAALDEEVPKQLGVSKAILENVIFCHQEESNWPLSQPADLKKKFDEIFEATKYTKALDQIKTLRKDQNVEIKVDKEKLAALKTDRDRAIKLRATIEKLTESIEIKQGDHEDLEAKIVKLSGENKKFYEQATKHHSIINKASTIRTQKNLVEENLAQVRANLQELPDTDQELAKKIESHESDLKAKREHKERIKRELQDEADHQEKLEKKRSGAQVTQGKLQAEKQRFHDNQAARQTLIKEIATKHSISGFDHSLGEEEMDEFVRKLDGEIEKQQKKIRDLKADARDSDRKKQEVISNLKIARSGDENQRTSVANQIRGANDKIRSINRKLEATTTSVADITYGESSLAEEKRRKKELEDTVAAANYPEQLRTKAAESRALEEKREALHHELSTLNRQADVRAKLGLKKTERGRKDEAIQSLIDKNTSVFKRHTKKDPERSTMEAEVNAVVKAHEQEINAADRSLRDAQKELSAVETGVNMTKSKLKELQTSATTLTTKIADGLAQLDTEKKSVQEAIAEAEEEVDAARTNVKDQEGLSKFYQRVLSKGKKDHICIGCNRDLSKKELSEFETFCKNQMDRAPNALKDAEEELRAWEGQLSDLRRLVPTEVAYTKLVNEDIPAADEAANRQSAKLPEVTAKSQEATERQRDLRQKLEELQLLRKTAGDVFRMHRECDDIDRDIAKLESELSASGSTATSDDIQDQLTKLSDQLRGISKSMENLRSESNKQQSTLQALSNSIHTAELQLNRKQQELKEKDALEKQKETTQTEVEELETKSRELDKKIKDSDAPLRKAEDEAVEARTHFNGQEAMASMQLSEFNKSFESLESNQREIRQYQTRGTEKELERCERELKQHESQVKEKKARVASLQTEISQIEKTLADSVAVLRNYEDNVQLRAGKRKIQDYEDQIAELDVESAEKAHRKFEGEYANMRKKQTDLQAQQAKLGGEIETLKTDLDSKHAEMKSEYDNIDAKYKTELIKVKTAEVANQDLEKYYKALDSAIMSFHGHKMKEINETIADLWTKTYQGTDIDKIMIKSDAEGKTMGGKSYNYRVVMQKDNTEMDMRGRCSAGQKVLASIIIRLALAESFGVNCGIMALDEPTTNLDHDNIQALASALSELIKERKGQSNFQLVVITHDEQFLETLGGTGVLDKYWRVSRGDGGQVSTIERQRLS
ncbi:DNA repair protein rad50 [Pseudohyphozyma bogoriensis]|nr:DNA repair protein rad50 [Pseudohyphozyma bogoriensis]